jgi:[ribosomal protein S5]-alanine N-acetyltransferase
MNIWFSRVTNAISRKNCSLRAQFSAVAGVRAHQLRYKPSLETAEIYLRNLLMSDVERWYSYLSVPEVVEHTSWNLSSKQDLVRLVESYNSDDPESQIRFAIIDKSDGDLVGTIGFHSVSEGSRSAEIAYDVHPEYWGRGIATQACQLVIEWGFKYRRLTRIQACILQSNKGSEKVLNKCGFKPEGLLSARRLVRGQPKDFLVYSVVLNQEHDNSKK